MIDTVFVLMFEDAEMDIDGEGNNEKMSIFFYSNWMFVRGQFAHISTNSDALKLTTGQTF